MACFSNEETWKELYHHTEAAGKQAQVHIILKHMLINQEKKTILKQQQNHLIINH